MIRTLIVDDEKLARERVHSFLRNIKDIEVIGQARNGVEAIRMIEEQSPDLVILDVQMPGTDGFGVLQAVTKQFQLVFSTAYDEYAIKAFEVQATDYLLKPISRQRLEEAVRRVRDRLDTHAPATDFTEVLKAIESRERRYVEQLPVHKGRQILILPIDEVYWFEVEYRLVYAHTASDRFMTNFTLKELEDRLDPETFFRAHKSRLVNLKRVKAIVPWFGGRFKLVMRNADSSEVELSRAQARVLRRQMRW
jgi:two-component system, LytTR family, response regulator